MDVRSKNGLWFARLTEYSKSRLTTGSLIIGIIVGYGFESFFSALIESLKTAPTHSFDGWQVWCSLIFFAHFLRFSIGNFLHLVADYWIDGKSIGYFVDLIVIGVQQALFVVAATSVFASSPFPSFPRLLFYICSIDAIWLLLQLLAKYFCKWRKYENLWPDIPQRVLWLGLNAGLCLALVVFGQIIAKGSGESLVRNIDGLDSFFKEGSIAIAISIISLAYLFFDLKQSPALTDPKQRALDEQRVLEMFEEIDKQCNNTDWDTAVTKTPICAVLYAPTSGGEMLKIVKFSKWDGKAETSAESRCLAVIDDMYKEYKGIRKKSIRKKCTMYCVFPPHDRDSVNNVRWVVFDHKAFQIDLRVSTRTDWNINDQNMQETTRTTIYRVLENMESVWEKIKTRQTNPPQA